MFIISSMFVYLLNPPNFDTTDSFRNYFLMSKFNSFYKIYNLQLQEAPSLRRDKTNQPKSILILCLHLGVNWPLKWGFHLGLSF